MRLYSVRLRGAQGPHQNGSAKPNHSVSPQLLVPGIIRLFDWIVIGENETVRKVSKSIGETAAAETYSTKLNCPSNILIKKEILVEAAGVEPASENVTGQETTCLFAFMPQALPWDVRGRGSERTRNRRR